MVDLKFSFVIPVFNRPTEIHELLQSLFLQTNKDFEVIIVEDGSEITSADVVGEYQKKIPVKYFEKENEGPGPARNFGVRKAKGEFVVFFDSDCILPPNYTKAVKGEIQASDIDFFGGPDRAHPDFTVIQKAINYAMTSFLTTGGIRGAKKRLDKFLPRSFNMGIKRSIFTQVKGFSTLRFGEDLDLSMRLLRKGFRSQYIEEAFVFHHRRSSFKQFFKQVFNSGIARVYLSKRHPGTFKWVHMLPSLFVLVTTVFIIAALQNFIFFIPVSAIKI